MSKVFTGDLELFKEFITFCESQPKDKEINHYSWKTCAVGDYARSKGIEAHKVISSEYLAANDSWVSVESLTGMDVNLTRTLGSELADYLCPNYREFTEFLKSYLPEEEA